MDELIHQWLEAFGLDAFVREHVAAVVLTLPAFVRDDLMGDPAFLLCDYEPPVFGGTYQVRVASPSAGTPGRSVALKRTLRRRPVEFVRYVIAHELAHAHLRNGGRDAEEDPELAADALAAEWGFPKPIW